MSNELFTQDYKKLCEEFHQTNPRWGGGPAVSLPDVYDFLRKYDCDLITDYGCGKGNLARVINQKMYRWQLYDPFVPEYSRDPMPLPYLVCCDVLEHIEPGCLDAVLDHIAEITGKVAFVAICTEPARETLPDGRNAHLLVHDYAWWHAKLAEKFTVVATRKGSTYCNYELEPKG